MQSLIGRGVRELRSREANLRVGDVVDVVEPLEERVAVDEVKALARVRAEVGGDEVDGGGVATNRSVELQGKV